MPMTWPFLSAVGSNAAVTPTLHATATQLPTATQQLLLAQRAVPRRRYL